MKIAANKSWNLEAFLDSLILELDKARDTLAIKGMNKPLTYTVKDLALDLQLFPEFNGDEVRFTTARPGETGASKVSIQLGAISDRQIRETTQEPIAKDDVAIDIIEDIDVETKKNLKKIGINSVKDLEKLEKRNVDLEDISKTKLKMDYHNLADKLKKIRSGKVRALGEMEKKDDRKSFPPKVHTVRLTPLDDQIKLSVLGENLVLSTAFQPIAFINQQPAKYLSGKPDGLELSIDSKVLSKATNELQIALDPYAIIKLNIQ